MSTPHGPNVYDKGICLIHSCGGTTFDEPEIKILFQYLIKTLYFGALPKFSLPSGPNQTCAVGATSSGFL